MVGPQLSDDVHKKVFFLWIFNLQRVVAEEREYDESEELGEMADENDETHFERAGRNFGGSRAVFQRGRVFRGRGERKKYDHDLY